MLMLILNVVHDSSKSPPFQLPEFMDGMAYVEGGIYERGCGQFGPEHGAPRHRVRLLEFMIEQI